MNTAKKYSERNLQKTDHSQKPKSTWKQKKLASVYFIIRSLLIVSTDNIGTFLWVAFTFFAKFVVFAVFLSLFGFNNGIYIYKSFHYNSNE